MARNKPRRSAPDPGDPVAQFLGVIADLLNEDQEMDPAQMKRALDEQIARNPLPPPVAGLSPERQARDQAARPRLEELARADPVGRVRLAASDALERIRP